MIKENQKLLNYINIISDGLIIYLSLPLAFYFRFYVLPGGLIAVPLVSYLRLGVLLTAVQLFTYATFGLYRSFRHTLLKKEMSLLFKASTLDLLLLFSGLFLFHGMHYSRWTLALFFALSFSLLGLKRVALRLTLRYFRQKGYNQKHVLILGYGKTALAYRNAIEADKALGYHCAGYVADCPAVGWRDVPYCGRFEDLEDILREIRPDEVVSAIELEDYRRMPGIIAACEKDGTKLSILPFFAEYVPAKPQFDEVGGLPLLNLRRIPLDNLVNAFCKRAMDVIGSACALVILSPVLLICAIGVKLSSPGPVIFRQMRVGRNKKHFYMYKFRSMRVNVEQDSAWSRRTDGRRTRFGSFLRKCSLDELPQLWNVLKGEMSLVGPRPELPCFVEQFREEVPLYMVKHQVRPGITGWAQVNGLRGDTSILKRVEYDVYYIEHWSLGFDIKILLTTVFRGKFLNNEVLAGSRVSGTGKRL